MRRGAPAVCALLCTLCQATSLLAHPQFALATVNRYTKLALLPHGQVRLLYTLMVGDVPAFDLRQRADRNHDGHLDQAEGLALAHELRDRVLAGLKVQLDGQPVVPAFDEPVLGLAGDAVAPSSFSVDLQAVIPVRTGAVHEIRYEDRTDAPPVGEVEVLLEEGLGVKLLAGYQGTPQAGPAERKTRIQFYGPPVSSIADRSVTLRFLEGSATAPRRSPWIWLLPFALLGIVGAWRYLMKKGKVRD